MRVGRGALPSSPSTPLRVTHCASRSVPKRQSPGVEAPARTQGRAMRPLQGCASPDGMGASSSSAPRARDESPSISTYCRSTSSPDPWMADAHRIDGVTMEGGFEPLPSRGCGRQYSSSPEGRTDDAPRALNFGVRVRSRWLGQKSVTGLALPAHSPHALPAYQRPCLPTSSSSAVAQRRARSLKLSTSRGKGSGGAPWRLAGASDWLRLLVSGLTCTLYGRLESSTLHASFSLNFILHSPGRHREGCRTWESVGGGQAPGSGSQSSPELPSLPLREQPSNKHSALTGPQKRRGLSSVSPVRV
jgi:hypothetical protein